MSIFAPPVPPPAVVSSPFALPETRRSAGRAWLFSMLAPGAGQLYTGARQRGMLMLVFFGIAVTFIIVGEGDVPWIGVRYAVMIYALSALDAYLTAREYNRGVDADASDNPRVAALLNLTTSGLGYMYLEQVSRGYAIAMILALNFIYRATGDRFPVLAEIVALSLALHAYRIAVHRREKVYPRAQRPVVHETSLPPIVPLMVPIVLAVAYYGLTIVAQIVVLTR